VNVVVRAERADALASYAAIPTHFTVTSVLEVEPADAGLGGITLRERVLAEPYVKDYGALEPPLRWPGRFDVSRWTLLAAYAGGERVGGAVVVAGAPDVELLGGRADLAVLWDIRVRPGSRGRGVGSALFRAAEAEARARGCRRVMVETQNTNVPACRFYARQGCTLGAIHRFAYPGLPHETQLLWFRDLEPTAS
jgi:ribosomal protein S18 acetylase RimI-like enzyme